MLKHNLDSINQAVANNIGMDVIIVSTSNKQQEQFWQKRLEKRVGEILKKDALVVAIDEDWHGGAGNSLGTLYTYQKGRQKIKELHNVDIQELQRNGASIAIYHTAGQGTRLSPLTASEYNNKPGVKLPGLMNDHECMTILEAVLKQTSIYAPSRKGRLSVFWGDQIFIPSKSCTYTPSHAIDILVKLNPMPTEEEWKTKGLDKYGLVAIDSNKDAQQIDKADFRTIQDLIQRGKISTHGGVGMSLGSFSLSYEMTLAMLEEFSSELNEKKAKMDVEPHIWMPTTLDSDTYREVMLKKKIDEQTSGSHHERMHAFKQRFLSQFPNANYFGAVDVGSDCYWWDYGTIDSYFRTNLMLVGQGDESSAMREFFRVKNEDLVDGSCLINCQIKRGTITRSVLIDVEATELNVDNSLIVDSSLKGMSASDALLYNVQEMMTLKLLPGTIRADLFLNAEHIKVYTKQGCDGKENWDKKLEGNKYSYAQLHEMCKTAVLKS
jgi:hypothetical protein